MKKPQAVVLSIPEPCSEDWNVMTPAGRGRHCASCHRTVVDFTGWSDAALAAFFARRENWQTCGRFYGSQLDRPIPLVPQPHSRLYRWVLAAGIASITFAVADSNAQTPSPGVPACCLPVVADTPGQSLRPHVDAQSISGTVVDVKGEPLINAAIRLFRAGVLVGGTVTDLDGAFRIPVADAPASEKGLMQIQVDYIGFASQAMDVTTDSMRVTLARISPSNGKRPVEIRTVGRMCPRLITDPGCTTITSDQLEHRH